LSPIYLLPSCFPVTMLCQIFIFHACYKPRLRYPPSDGTNGWTSYVSADILYTLLFDIFFCLVIDRLIVVHPKFMCYLVKFKFSLVFQNKLKQRMPCWTLLLHIVLFLHILYSKCHIQKKPIYSTATNYSITDLVDIGRNPRACIIAVLKWLIHV
jgi:hypothetical protein